MKKLLLIAALGLMAIDAAADVKIEMKGISNDSVKVGTLNVVATKRLAPDTVMVAKNGKLTLPDVKENTVYVVTPLAWVEKRISPARLYVAPGEKFKVAFTQKGDACDTKVSGSAIQTMIDDFQGKMSSLVEVINGKEKGAERDSLIEKYYSMPDEYVSENLDSPIALYVLAHSSSTEFQEATLPKIGSNAKASMFGEYEQFIKQSIERQHEIDAAKKKTAEGEMAPDFELPTPDGGTLKMSSLRGKWVLVDFWGSWCIWCIRGIPQLKENYAKYQDKMEVLSIACRDKKDKWLAAIEKHQLGWKHVISLENVPGTDKRVEALYGVEGYPTKLLVDPEGRIVKRCVGEDPSFYADFDKLMK